MSGMDEAMATPDRARGASFRDRLDRRAGGRSLVLCAGIDPSPAALELLAGRLPPRGGGRDRATVAGVIERFAGLLVESVRDHAVAVKPQVAWFEAAGAPGMRALERTVEFARTAGLMVVLDAKRGDVPHTAQAYAEAWLGDEASTGAGGDALTVNAAIGADSLDAMATVAAGRNCALYALLHTSNPGASHLQAARLADGRPWWHLLAEQLAGVDAAAGGGVVGAVVGATHPAVVAEARALLPHAPLLVPGTGTQGGRPDDLRAAAGASTAPATLVVAARSLLPAEPSHTQAFRFAVDGAAGRLVEQLAPAECGDADHVDAAASGSIQP